MSRQDTQIIKGVAIMLMLFLHLFNRQGNVELCRPFLYIDDTPLLAYLVRVANPVPYFIIISGSGLYISHHKGSYNTLNKLKRIYVHYWLSLHD